MATGVDVGVQDIAERICDSLGKPRSLITHVADRAGSGRPPHRLQRARWPSSSAGGRAVGLDEGLERTIRWYAENPAWWAAHVAAIS